MAIYKIQITNHDGVATIMPKTIETTDAKDAYATAKMMYAQEVVLLQQKLAVIDENGEVYTK